MSELDGKLDARLKGSPLPQNKDVDAKTTEERPKKSTLERALEDEDDDLATELKRSRAAEVVTRRQLSIKQMNQQLNKNGAGEGEDDSKPKSKRWTVIEGTPIEDTEGEYSTFAQALAMAKASIKWAVIDGRPVESEDGEYRTFAQALSVAAMERQGAEVKRWSVLDDKPFEDPNGEFSSFAEAYRVSYLGVLKKNAEAELKAAQLAQANKPKNEDSEQIKMLVSTIGDLRRKIEEVSNPFETMRRAKVLKDEFMEAGLISPPGEPADPANSVELTKEKNRHDEEMKKLDADARYKESISNTVAGLPRIIGAGISQDILKGLGSPSPDSVEAAVERFPCKNCGAQIVAGAGATSVTCAKCGMEFRKGGQPDPMGEK
jgi:hypothetical protein